MSKHKNSTSTAPVDCCISCNSQSAHKPLKNQPIPTQKHCGPWLICINKKCRHHKHLLCSFEFIYGIKTSRHGTNAIMENDKCFCFVNALSSHSIEDHFIPFCIGCEFSGLSLKMQASIKLPIQMQQQIRSSVDDLYFQEAPLDQQFDIMRRKETISATCFA